MATTTFGRSALALALGSALAAPSPSVSRPANLVVERSTAESLGPGDTLHATAAGTMAARLEPRATLDAEEATFINDGASSRAARAYGIFVANGGGLSLTGSRVTVSGPWGIGIQVQRKGEASFEDARVESQGTQGVGLLVTGTSHVAATRSHVQADGAGATALALDSGEVYLRDSVLHATDGYAIGTRFQRDGTARVRLENSAVRGRIESGAPALSIHASGGSIEGDISRAGRGALELRLADGVWRGSGRQLTALSLDHAVWTLTGDSDVGTVLLERQGRVAFARDQPGFRTLRAGNWHADAGSVALGTRLDAGGSLRRQATDRLLIDGSASGRTALHIANVGGNGAPTTRRDANGPGDGISVVQVGGPATAASFYLADDYVVVGPWQYRLHAYEPGRSDPAQRLVDGEGSGYWDFRLQSARAGGASSRAALAPQVPAYLVLAHAIFGYGRSAMDALRPVDVVSSREPAMRVRAFGGAARYRNSLAGASYGVDYQRRDRGLQIAGDMVVHAIGETTVRTGAAITMGSSKVSPRAADGSSDARTNARGVGWHAVLMTESGWELSSAYSFTHYRIDVHTPSRGEVLSRLRANANEASVSAAFHWRPSARLLVEPGVSVLWQRLRFSVARDRDHIMLSARSPRRLTTRAGARASLLFQPAGSVLYAWKPYLDLRYGMARDSGTSIRASGQRLPTGRAGLTIDVRAGAAFELGARWTASIDASAWRGSESSRTVRLGAAWTF